MESESILMRLGNCGYIMLNTTLG